MRRDANRSRRPLPSAVCCLATLRLKASEGWIGQGVFTSNLPLYRVASLNFVGTLSKLPVPVALA
jgi:hypothetical protein